MFFAILQAAHGEIKGNFFFFFGWIEREDPVSFPHCIHVVSKKKAWKCRWKVREITAFRNKKSKKLLLLFYAFGEMQPGCK